jgi:hypothetical protein
MPLSLLVLTCFRTCIASDMLLLIGLVRSLPYLW